MANNGLKGESDAQFARRIDPAKEPLSPEQIQFIRKVELEHWRRNTSKLRTRNVFTGLAIGAFVMGILVFGDIRARSLMRKIDSDGYTFFSVSQEKIMDEIDEEAKLARTRGPRTAAN